MRLMLDREKIRSFVDLSAIFLPFLLSPLFLFPKVPWLWAAALIPLVCGLRMALYGRPLEPSPINALILFLLITVGVSLYATFDIRFSLAKVTGTLLGALVFLAIIQFARTERRFILCLIFYLAGGCALALISLIGTAWWAKFPLMGKIVEFFPTRFKGLPGAEEGFNPNAIGGTLSLFFPLVLMVAVFLVRSRHRLAGVFKYGFGGAVFLLFLMAGVLLLCQSRGAWLATGLALGLFILPVSRWIRWAAVGAGGISAMLVIVFKPWTAWTQASANGLSSGGDMTMAVRLEIWSRAIYGIQDFPFTGMGMNAFRKVVHVLYPLFTIAPDVDVAHCHNQLLQAALDLGIPGLVAYVGIWAAAFALLWRVSRHSRDPFHRAIALGLAGGLLAQFLFGITDAIALGAKVGIFWWIALALTVSLEKLERETPANQTSITPKRPRIWELPVLWILISLASISFVGDHPYISLSMAVLGGIYLGFESARRYHLPEYQSVR